MAFSAPQQMFEVDFHTLFESIPAMYLVLSPELVIVAATDSYLHATFTSRADIIGRDLFEVFPDNPKVAGATGVRNLRASLDLVRRDLVADTMAVQRYDVRRPGAEDDRFEVRYWSPINSPVLDVTGRLSYIVHRVEDVTAFMAEGKDRRNPSQSDVEATIDAMHMELLHRSLELQSSNQRLVDMNSAKSDFLSRMSHELRTPMNSILGFAQVLDRQELDDDRRESVRHILKAGHHLLELINDVLDITRIEARRLELSVEPVPVDQLINETISLMSPMANERRVEIIGPEFRQELVHADRQRLRQVLLNLLSNAVKYNRPGGSINFTFALSSDDRLRISVCDTGYGIAERHFGEVFAPFGRFGDLQIEGSGIGLALSKNLIEAMGGTIGFASVENEGSEFWIELEIDSMEDTFISGAPRPQGGQGIELSARVLCVEDNAANLTLIERILQSYGGLELITATEGRRGIELAHESRPDIILLDIHLPDMTGSDVIVELQADLDTAHIPVVVLSADATERQMRRMLELGAVAYLTKPIMLDEFDQVMTSLLAPKP